MELIPDSILLEIFTYLSKKDVLTISQVSKRWQRICYDRSLWKNICSQDLGCYDKDIINKLINNGNGGIISLSLNNYTETNNNILMNLALVSNKLQHLNLMGCFKVSDRGIKTLAKYCTTLKTVNLLNTSVTEFGLSHLISQNLNLQELTANCVAVTEATVNVLAGHCKFLEVLQVEENECWAQLKPTKKRVSVLTNSMIAVLAINCPHLCMLVMNYEIVRLSNWVMVMLGQNCRNLECVEIIMPVQSSELSDEGIVNLCLSLENLRHLHLSETEVTDITLHAIANSCKDLTHLSLDRCQQFSDMGVLNLLKNCTQLESLSLGSGWDGNLTDLSAFCIARSPCVKSLIHLSMRLWDLTDLGLTVLSCHIPNLLQLSIEGAVKVTYNGLTNALTSWKMLKCLDISFTHCVSCDEDLVKLSNKLDNLERLIAYECSGISGMGLNNLKTALPFCSIESEKIILL